MLDFSYCFSLLFVLLFCLSDVYFVLPVSLLGFYEDFLHQKQPRAHVLHPCLARLQDHTKYSGSISHALPLHSVLASSVAFFYVLLPLFASRSRSRPWEEVALAQNGFSGQQWGWIDLPAKMEGNKNRSTVGRKKSLNKISSRWLTDNYQTKPHPTLLVHPWAHFRASSASGSKQRPKGRPVASDDGIVKYAGSGIGGGGSSLLFPMGIKELLDRSL